MADPRRRSGRALTAVIDSGKGTVDLMWSMGCIGATRTGSIWPTRVVPRCTQHRG